VSERLAGFALPKAEMTQAAKHPLGAGHGLGRRLGAVGGFLGVANGEPGRARVHDELAAEDGAMVCGSQGDEVFRLVAPAFGAGAQVVDVDERGVATTGHDATAGVARQHPSAHGGRDGLGRALGLSGWRLARRGPG
jgi:hypothetical protein